MVFQKSYDEARPVREATCIHLRSKAIYVTGSLRNPDHPDEEGSQYCWCNKTQHVKGPDQNSCDPQFCTPGRECFQDSYDV